MFPWTVALTLKTGSVFCGGTLLTNKLVLTAAHCIHGKNDEYKFTTENITVVLGAHDLNNPNETGREFLNVTKIEIHEDWNITSESFDADVAILKLEKYVTYNKFIQPICLISPDSILPSKIINGYTVGFGLSDNNEYENVLKYVNIPIQQDHAECFFSNHALLSLSSNRTFCGGARNGSSVCIGDSGNGLFIRDRSTYYLRGMVSSSLADPDGCDVYNYAIFTNVIKFYEWIKNKLRNCHKVSLIGSHFVDPNAKSYKTYLYTQDLPEGTTINISIAGQEFNDFKIYDNFVEFPNNIAKFKLKKPLEPEYELKISYNSPSESSCKDQSIKLINLSLRPLVLIQINKPVYKIDDPVKFQIILLNQKLVPFDQTLIKQMNVKIIDSNNKTVQEYNNVTITEYGVFEDSFNVPQTENFGKWKLQVDVNGKRRMKTFDVQNYDANAIQIDLKIRKEVSYLENDIQMEINVKHPSNKHVSGDLNITVDAYSLDKHNLTIFRGKKIISKFSRIKIINFWNDLGILLPTTDMILHFNVSIIDQETKNKSSVDAEVVLRAKSRRKISIIRNKYFRPGLKFSATAKVRTFDGKPDDSTNLLEVTVKYHSIESPPTIKKNLIKLKNGDATIIMNPKKSTQNIEVELKFEETTLKEIIEPISKSDEYIKVMSTKKIFTNGTLTGSNVAVQASNGFRSLRILVLSQNGISYKKNYDAAAEHNHYNFSITYTDDMKPESTLFVYDFASDGDLIYDTRTLTLNVVSSNVLKVETVSTANPDQPIDINFSTKDGSKVYLSAIEQTSAPNHGLSADEVYNEIVSYMSLEFPKKYKHEFDESNFFVMEPLKFPFCNDNPIFKDSFEEFQEESFDAFVPKISYFPDTWFDKELTAASDRIIKLEEQVQSQTANWQIFGVSIHPTKGFAVTPKSININVRKLVWIGVQVPTSTRENEIFEIKIDVLNFSINELNSTIIVKAENGEVVDMEIHQCNIIGPMTTVETLLQANSNPEHHSFLVRSLKKGSMKITAAVETGILNDETKNTIIVKGKKNRFKEIIKSVLINLRATESSNADAVMVLKSNYKVVSDVSIYGNLLGPMIEGLEKVFTQFDYDEFRIDKLAISIINYKFLKAINESDHDLAKKAFKDMENGKIEAENILKSEIKLNRTSNIRLAAYAVQVLSDSSEFLAIDKTLIDAAAIFIMNLQNSNGSFSYDIKKSYRVDMGSARSQIYIQTAFVISTFLKHDDLKEQYKVEIQKSLEFLNSSNAKHFNNDYEKILTAYVFALNDDYTETKSFFRELQNVCENPALQKKHKSLCSESTSTIVLTKLLSNWDPVKEVEWLIKHRNADGTYYSSYGTVLALQALFEYTKFKNFPKPDLGVNITSKYERIKDHLDKRSVEVYTKNINIKASGEGLAYASVSTEEEAIKSSDKLGFNITADVQNIQDNNYKIQVDVTLKASRSQSFYTANFMIVEIEIPNGYKLKQDELKTHNLFKHEYIEEKNLVIYHAKQIKGNENTFMIEITKVYDVKNLAPSTITVYDYYRRNIIDVKTYKLGESIHNCN